MSEASVYSVFHDEDRVKLFVSRELKSGNLDVVDLSPREARTLASRLLAEADRAEFPT